MRDNGKTMGQWQNNGTSATSSGLTELSPPHRGLSSLLERNWASHTPTGQRMGPDSGLSMLPVPSVPVCPQGGAGM